MIPITKNLLSNYFLPLLREVLTDVAEGKKNQYLSKLLIAEDFTPLEKTNFMNDYFLTRPSYQQYLGSASDADRNFFREQFLAELAKGLENRLVLSGFAGLKKAYLPDEKKTFNYEKQRNVYLLAYNMALGFEKKQTQLLIQQKSENKNITPDQTQKDLQMLEKGELKLLQINGQWQYVAEDQLKLIAANPKYGTLQVTPYISCNFIEVESTAQSEVSAQQKFAEQTGTDQTQTSESELISLGEMNSLLNESKLAQLEMILSERGLNVVDHLQIDDFGVVTGKVSDPQGQIYEIHIDTSNGIDPKNLKINYTLIKEPAKKSIPEEKKKETIRVDFSKLELKVKPQKTEKPQEQEVVIPAMSQPSRIPTQEASVFVLPQGQIKLPATTFAPVPKEAKKSTIKPKSVMDHKMARENKPSQLGQKPAPQTKRPPQKQLPRNFAPPVAPQQQSAPGGKASKNPMVRFAKWGTFGAIAGFLGAASFFLKS